MAIKTVVLTHTDLDGCVSGWLAGRAYETESVLSCNYHEVTEKLEMAYFSYGKNTDLVITDLNILPENLQYALIHFNTVTIFDHHPSSEAFIPLMDINDKFKLYWNDKVCATTLVQKFMQDSGYKEFTDIEMDFFRFVNLYDNWKHEHREFPYARMANDLFWHYGWSNFLNKLKTEGALDIPDGLTHEELQHCKDNFLAIEQAGRECEWYNTDSGSTIAILEEHQKVAINNLSEHIDSQTGIYYMVYFYKNWKCAMRVRHDHQDNYHLGKGLEKFFETSDLLDNCGGHANAAGSSFKKDVKMPEALAEIERFDTFLLGQLALAS